MYRQDRILVPSPNSTSRASSGRVAADQSMCQQIEPMRPVQCCLSIKDYSILEGELLRLDPSGGGIQPLLLRLIRTKLSEARIVPMFRIPRDVATIGSRVVFSSDARGDENMSISHTDDIGGTGLTISVSTLLGATLLGMCAGQEAALVRADGSLGQVALREVAYQPEAFARKLGTVLRAPDL